MTGDRGHIRLFDDDDLTRRCALCGDYSLHVDLLSEGLSIRFGYPFCRGSG